MIIEKYGVRLRSIEPSMLEKVRSWRNKEHVREAMFYREIITPHAQEKWFEGLFPDNWYFLVESPEPIGVVHVKSVEWMRRTGEAGIFIGEEEHLNDPVNVVCILALMDTFFDQFGFTMLYARVRTDRKDLIQMNQQLGYQISATTATSTSLWVDQENYLRATELLRRSVGRRNPDFSLQMNAAERTLFFPSEEG